MWGILERSLLTPSMTQSNQPNANTTQPAIQKVGELGEELVAQWLQAKGWIVLERRWHSRWGELDLIVARPEPTPPHLPVSLAFVEVKTRSRTNWDNSGALAISAQKQAKLWKTAQLFLVAHPDLAELPCQFDVALVSCRKVPSKKSAIAPPLLLTDQISLTAAGYHLVLLDYIQAAFVL
jgi:putative endonuclease